MKYWLNLPQYYRLVEFHLDGCTLTSYAPDPNGDQVGFRVVEIEADTYEEACQKAKEME